MIKNRIFRALIVIAIVVSFSCSPKNSDSAQGPLEKNAASASPRHNLPFRQGETVKYIVKNLGVKAGEATLTFNGLTKLNGQDVVSIVFRANGMNFFDEERIYADPENFYPVLIKRDLNIWGKKEKIEEHYETGKGHIKIIKHVGGKTQEQIIKKEGKIDNIYCFIYRYRKSGQFKIGDSFTVRLPTKDIEIELTKKTNLKAAGQKYEAYYMKSHPPKYQIWFDASSQRIPLRINGSIGISATSMIMVEYIEGDKKGQEGE